MADFSQFKAVLVDLLENEKDPVVKAEIIQKIVHIPEGMLARLREKIKSSKLTFVKGDFLLNRFQMAHSIPFFEDWS